MKWNNSIKNNVDVIRKIDVTSGLRIRLLSQLPLPEAIAWYFSPGRCAVGFGGCFLFQRVRQSFYRILHDRSQVSWTHYKQPCSKQHLQNRMRRTRNIIQFLLTMFNRYKNLIGFLFLNAIMRMPIKFFNLPGDHIYYYVNN